MCFFCPPGTDQAWQGARRKSEGIGINRCPFIRLAFPKPCQRGFGVFAPALSPQPPSCSFLLLLQLGVSSFRPRPRCLRHSRRDLTRLARSGENSQEIAHFFLPMNGQLPNSLTRTFMCLFCPPGTESVHEGATRKYPFMTLMLDIQGTNTSAAGGAPCRQNSVVVSSKRSQFNSSFVRRGPTSLSVRPRTKLLILVPE